MNAAWVRRGATAMAAARTAIGVVALASPALVGRPWVGAATDGTPGRVLARALGGRDLALGLGALAALSRLPSADGPGGSVDVAGSEDAGRAAGMWVGLGALADSLDVLITAAAWDELPALGRWLVAMSAGGAAATGAVAARTLIAEDRDLPSRARPT